MYGSSFSQWLLRTTYIIHDITTETRTHHWNLHNCAAAHVFCNVVCYCCKHQKIAALRRHSLASQRCCSHVKERTLYMCLQSLCIRALFAARTWQYIQYSKWLYTKCAYSYMQTSVYTRSVCPSHITSLQTDHTYTYVISAASDIC